jgi:hypothetical protein
MDVNKKGQVLVFFAISVVVLLGFAALGIDVGYMYSVRHDLQRSADAGALAGASRFINDVAAGETGQWGDAAVFAEATTRAIAFATKDNVVQTKLDPSNGNDNVIVTFDQGPDRIKVQTERTVPLFFAKLFLGATKRITAFAVAEAASISENTTCLAPFGVPLPWIESTPDPTDPDHWKFNDGPDTVYWPDTGDPGADKAQMDATCDGFGVGPANITHWDYASHAIDNTTYPQSPRDGYLCPGTLMHLKIGDPKATQEPGHFYGLDFSKMVSGCPEGTPGGGASFYKFMIKNKDCNSGCTVDIDASDPLGPLTIEPGNMVGPTVQAVAPTYYKTIGDVSQWPDLDSLMNGYGPPDPSDYDAGDNYGDPDADWEFGTNTPQTTVTDRRIIEVPVYDPRFPPDPGKSTIKPVAFAGFWIQDIDENQGTITARVISIKGAGMGGPGPGPGGAVTKTIRLVE